MAAVIVMSAKEEVRQSRIKSEPVRGQGCMVCNKSYIHVSTIVISKPNRDVFLNLTKWFSCLNLNKLGVCDEGLVRL